jgi:hypothetical protein
MEGPLVWRARLKKDIRLTSVVFRKGTIVRLYRNVRGHVHVVGYQAATVADKDWELVWDEHGLQKILQSNGEDHEFY